MSGHFSSSRAARYCVLILIFISFILLFFGLSSLGVTFASAESVEAGVKPGDWIKYELNWTLPPAPPYALKIRREILAVNESVLTVRITQNMSDGSVKVTNSTGDFINGTGAAAMIFIPPNLRPGDQVNIQGFGVVSINGTDQRTYLGTERTVLWSNFLEKDFDILVFWDKETGVALEIHILHSSRQGVTKIVAGDFWHSGYNLLEIGVLLLIITIVTVALLLWRYTSSKK